MEKFTDNIVFEDSKSRDKVIFNKYTFYKILKGCIIRYSNKNENEADKLIKASKIYPLPNSYEDALFITHEHEYHWAMVIAYGENYWQNSTLNINGQIPEDYDEWEKEYILKNNLSENTYEYL